MLSWKSNSVAVRIFIVRSKQRSR